MCYSPRTAYNEAGEGSRRGANGTQQFQDGFCQKQAPDLIFFYFIDIAILILLFDFITGLSVFQ